MPYSAIKNHPPMSNIAMMPCVLPLNSIDRPISGWSYPKIPHFVIKTLKYGQDQICAKFSSGGVFTMGGLIDHVTCLQDKPANQN